MSISLVQEIIFFSLKITQCSQGCQKGTIWSKKRFMHMFHYDVEVCSEMVKNIWVVYSSNHCSQWYQDCPVSTIDTWPELGIKRNKQVGIRSWKSLKILRRPYGNLPVHKKGLTRRLERYFAQGHVDIKQGGMALSWKGAVYIKY